MCVFWYTTTLFISCYFLVNPMKPANYMKKCTHACLLLIIFLRWNHQKNYNFTLDLNYSQIILFMGQTTHNAQSFAFILPCIIILCISNTLFGPFFYTRSVFFVVLAAVYYFREKKVVVWLCVALLRLDLWFIERLWRWASCGQHRKDYFF